MPDDASSDTPEFEHRTQPMSRRASKIFAVMSVVMIIGITAAGSYFLISITSEALDEAPENGDAAPADTTAMEMDATPSALPLLGLS